MPGGTSSIGTKSPNVSSVLRAATRQTLPSSHIIEPVFIMLRGPTVGPLSVRQLPPRIQYPFDLRGGAKHDVHHVTPDRTHPTQRKPVQPGWHLRGHHDRASGDVRAFCPAL